MSDDDSFPWLLVLGLIVLWVVVLQVALPGIGCSTDAPC